MSVFAAVGRKDITAFSNASFPKFTLELAFGGNRFDNPSHWILLNKKPRLKNIKIYGSAKLDITSQLFPGLDYLEETIVIEFSYQLKSDNALEQLVELIMGERSSSFIVPSDANAEDWHSSLIAAFWPGDYGRLSGSIAFLMAILDSEEPFEDAKRAVRFIRLIESFRRIFNLAETYHFYLEHKEYIDRTVRSNLKAHIDGSPNYIKIQSMLSNRVKQQSEYLRIDTDDLTCMSEVFSRKSLESVTSWQDYENACLETLELNGYQSQLTRIGADFGGDITCKRNDRSYVIQCKKLSKAVGISAVQEAIAARIHYAVDFAVVVSESGFTKAASELAESSDTLLTRSSRLGSIEANWN